jgi:hypothetical protein
MTTAQKDNAVHLAKQIDDFGHDIPELNTNNRSERIHRFGTKYNMRESGRARNQGRLVWDEEKLFFPTFHSNDKRIGSSYVTHDLQLSLPAVQISLSKKIPRQIRSVNAVVRSENVAASQGIRISAPCHTFLFLLSSLSVRQPPVGQGLLIH